MSDDENMIVNFLNYKLIKNKLPKTFLSKYFFKNLNIKNSLTVFEPKHPFGDLYKTSAIPSSHKGLKSYLKDSPVCLDLAYFQPKN